MTSPSPIRLSVPGTRAASGLGQEGAREGLAEYLDVKLIGVSI